MRYLHSLAIVTVLGGFTAVAFAPGCGTEGSEFPPGGDPSLDGSFDDDSGSFFNGDGGNEAKPPCVGLECQVEECGSSPTTVTGVVYDPAGKVPLYNVIVYIPRDPSAALDPITDGATCEQCAATIKGAVATALTNTKGEFTLANAPVGTDIPLVMQIGKWRRKVTLPKIDRCKANPIANKDQTRLPRNKTEGSIPKMAAVSGGADPLPCMFRRMGLDAAEMTAPSGTGRMHIYTGEGYAGNKAGWGVPSGVPAPPPVKPEVALWNNKAALKKYDIVFLSCEGDEYNDTKTAAQKTALRDFLNEGGRAFATHFHYTWFKNGPADVQSVAEWTTSATGANPFSIDTSFPKGVAFADWLKNVGAIMGANATNNTINLTEIRNDVTKVNAPGTRWVYKPAAGGQPDSAKYLTFNTPIGQPADKQCGRAVFSDIHVSTSTNDDTRTIPGTCRLDDLTPQEKALEFLFFDLSACVQDDQKPPEPPGPR